MVYILTYLFDKVIKLKCFILIDFSTTKYVKLKKKNSKSDIFFTTFP